MEVAELFDTGVGIDLETPSSRACVKAYGADASDPLAASLRGSDLVHEACSIVDFLLEDFDVSERAREALFEFGVLVLAVTRDVPTLRDHVDSADLDALANAGGGEFEHGAGPMSRSLTRLVAALRDEPGWALGGNAALSRLRNAASGYAQARRLEEFATGALTPSLAAASRGGWKEALVETACVACNDNDRATKSEVADLVERFETRKLVDRAKEAGCPVLVLLADTPTFGYRPREIRNGLAIPPRMSLRNLLQMGGEHRASTCNTPEGTNIVTQDTCTHAKELAESRRVIWGGSWHHQDLQPHQ